MSHILLIAEPGKDADGIFQALKEESHAPIRHEPGSDSSVEELVKIILDAGPELVIMDFFQEDALSVKTMQNVHKKHPNRPFIFLVNSETPLSHLVMAMNEGAAALLEKPVSREALFNQATRSLTRAAEARDRAAELEQYRLLAEEGQGGKASKSSLKSNLVRSLQTSYRLINHLLAVKLSKQDRKILLVSDSAYQLELFRKNLEEHNFEVLTAADGEKGLEAARESQPKIIVSDLEMPGLNGLQLCQAVKNDPSCGPNHFIIFTASEERMEEVLSPEYKVDDCLLKPRRPQDFQEFIARVAFGLLV